MLIFRSQKNIIFMILDMEISGSKIFVIFLRHWFFPTSHLYWTSLSHFTFLSHKHTNESFCRFSADGLFVESCVRCVCVCVVLLCVCVIVTCLSCDGSDASVEPLSYMSKRSILSVSLHTLYIWMVSRTFCEDCEKR